MRGSSYATGPVTKAPAWHGLVAWDMLFNGMTTGLFLVAAISELVAPDVFTSVAKAAYPVALVLLLVDLLYLVLDLGDPLRFHHMLRVFKPSSPMSLGTWCLTIFSLPLTVAAAISLLPAGWMTLEWVRRLAVIAGLLPALGSAVYKGVLLGTSSQPGWKDARWLGGYLTSSALMLGCAEMFVLSVLMGHASAAAILRPALGLLLVLNLIPLCLLLADLRTTLLRIYSRRELYGVGALSLGGGADPPMSVACCGQLSRHAWRCDVHFVRKSGHPLRDRQVASRFSMNMRGKTQTSGDGQLEHSHIDAGIACLVRANNFSGSDGGRCALRSCRLKGPRRARSAAPGCLVWRACTMTATKIHRYKEDQRCVCTVCC